MRELGVSLLGDDGELLSLDEVMARAFGAAYAHLNYNLAETARRLRISRERAARLRGVAHGLRRGNGTGHSVSAS